MTGWDFLDRFMNTFPPIAATILFVAVLVIFIIGFSKHGLNFLKYGFKQTEIGSLSTKISEVNAKIDGLQMEVNAKIDGLQTEFNTRIDGLQTEFRTELATIKTNHFGHLKGFLTELTSILLDKEILNNTDKARQSAPGHVRHPRLIALSQASLNSPNAGPASCISSVQ